MKDLPVRGTKVILNPAGILHVQRNVEGGQSILDGLHGEPLIVLRAESDGTIVVKLPDGRGLRLTKEHISDY